MNLITYKTSGFSVAQEAAAAVDVLALEFQPAVAPVPEIFVDF